VEIKPIKSGKDHQAALKLVESMMGAKRNTAEGDRFEVLTILIEHYERKRFALDIPDPVEAVKFEMERRQLSPKDLVPMIGPLNRVYEVLNRKRKLSLLMKQRLHAHLGIPAEILLHEVSFGGKTIRGKANVATSQQSAKTR
jgi:HTH-type transcriptional regulator/antitoxin HigA